jgi:hypothetical protein
MRSKKLSGSCFYLDIFLKHIFFSHYFIMANKIPTFGSRIQVYRGHAKKTSGGLTKSDLMMNKHGRVVSKAKHFTSKKEMRLLKYGYGTKKGKFGFVKVGSKSRRSRSNSKSRSKSRKMRGGMSALSPLDLVESAGAGITNFGSGSNDVQTRAGMAGGRRRKSGAMGMAGGSGMAPMSPQADANWYGDVIRGASMSGGMNMAKARSLQRAKTRGMVLKSKSKGAAASLAMTGGTTSPHSQFLPTELSSVDVQMRAGLGN